MGVDAYLVDDPMLVKQDWFLNKKRVGVTAGASAPEVLTQEIVTVIKSFGLKVVKTLPGIEENIVFTMPKGLQPHSHASLS
jgi:4-hydroxy-3-methylbut-2-enyl diphosphate reductase